MYVEIFGMRVTVIPCYSVVLQEPFCFIVFPASWLSLIGLLHLLLYN
jgi:hypothetical protein